MMLLLRVLVPLCLVLLGGCSAFHSVFPSAPAAAPAPVLAAPSETVQRIPFHTGVSSATVEKLARAESCLGGQGAGLITGQGPVEVYRMVCDGGKVFMARCEMRQCRKM
jgi:predicted transcriptional regulator